MANALKDKYDDLNPGDVHARDTFENDGQHDKDSGISDADRQAEADSLEDAYNAPSASDPTWDSSKFTGAGSKAKGKIKKGPLGAIIGVILAAGGVTGLGFGAVAIEPIWIIQSIFNNGTLNPRSTIATRITNKIMYDKFEAKATDGICGAKISILCKFSRPSNYQLKKMEALGYSSVDKAGKSVRTSALFPNKRPDFIVYTDSKNVIQKIPASSIRAQMKLDPKFDSDMLKIYNPRYASAADNAVTKVKKLFGYNQKDKLKNVPADEIDDTINKASAGADVGVSEATDEVSQQALIKKLFGEEMEKSFTKLGQSGKGDAIGLSLGAVCLATDVPGVAIKVARAYQMAQIIRYGAVFMAAAGAIQAGDGTAAEASGLGKQLTQKDSNGKAATDSFGIRSDLSSTTVTPTDTSYQKFIPGFSAAAALGSVAAILDSKAKKDTCLAASNPVTGVAINAALAPETLGLGTLLNVVVGITAAAAIQQLAGPLASLVVNAIPPSVYTSVLSAFLGDTTKGLVGSSAGNGLASAFESMLSQTCSAAGCTPLSVDSAVAFTKDSQETDLAYAQLDRATHSPLDASNPNTALGSFVGQFVPYYSQMGSISGVMSMLGSLTGNSISSLLSANLSAADPSQRFTQCPLQGTVIPKENATSNFCSLYYGIDPQYLDSSDPNVSDPLTIATNLVAAGQIDEYTGDPVEPSDPVTSATNAVFGANPDDQSTYASWQALCTDGTLDHVSECTSTSTKQAAYSVYNNATYIRAGMDGEDTSLTGSSTSTSDSTTSAYNSEADSLFALLDTFNQAPVPVATNSIIPTTTQSTPNQVATVAKRLSTMHYPVTVGFGVMV